VFHFLGDKSGHPVRAISDALHRDLKDNPHATPTISNRNNFPDTHRAGISEIRPGPRHQGAPIVTLIRTVLLICILPAFRPVHAADTSKATTFDSNGVKIKYTVEGKGDPVVLIHGAFSSADMNWRLPGTIRLLDAHYQVITLDVRGHGGSDKPAPRRPTESKWPRTSFVSSIT
jgi:hypothetical protein